jgi:hypothetical protein
MSKDVKLGKTMECSWGNKDMIKTEGQSEFNTIETFVTRGMN